MFEFNDKQFNEAHSEANGEGAEYIENLALALAGSLTKAGVKFNGKRLIEELNSIADNEGIETIRNAALLQTRLQLTEIIEPVNPEDLYGNTLRKAYETSISMSIGQEVINCINNMPCEFSKAFEEHGIRMSENQIKTQLSDMLNYQIDLDLRQADFFDSEQSVLKMIVKSNHFIKNLCIRLQLAGLLE